MPIPQRFRNWHVNQLKLTCIHWMVFCLFVCISDPFCKYRVVCGKPEICRGSTHLHKHNKEEIASSSSRLRREDQPIFPVLPTLPCPPGGSTRKSAAFSNSSSTPIFHQKIYHISHKFTAYPIDLPHIQQIYRISNKFNNKINHYMVSPSLEQQHGCLVKFKLHSNPP